MFYNVDYKIATKLKQIALKGIAFNWFNEMSVRWGKRTFIFFLF